jgi:outer membrane protein OmpA-like peptidoglycan-associated protein
MSKKSIYLLGIILTIIIGAILCYVIHCDCHLNKDANLNSHKTEISNVTTNPFSVSDGASGFAVNAADNFNFLTSNSSFITPVSSDVLSGVAKIKDQLLKNPSQILDVTGFYKSTETNNSKFDNLGLARANSIKDYLVSLGVPANQVNPVSKLNDGIVADANNTLFGPLAFNFSGTNTPVTKVASGDSKVSDVLKANNGTLKGTTFVLNFASGQSTRSLSASQREKLNNISNAVKGSDLSISVVGHTDSDGGEASNKVLGKKRAEYVKDHLLKHGVSANKVITSSKGEDQPVASNATANGKFQNRRIVITIN